MSPTIERSHTAAMVVASLAFVTLLALGFDAIVRVHADDEALSQSRTLHARLDDLQITMLDLERALDGYLLTLDRRLLAEHRAASDRLEDRLGRIDELLPMHPEQADHHAQLVSLARRQREFLRRTIELADARAVAEATAQSRFAESQVLMDEIRGVLQRMRAEEEGGLDAQQARTRASIARAARLGGAMAALTALLLAASYLASRRERAAQQRALRSETAAKQAAQEKADAEARLAARAAAALDDSEARLRGVFESASDAILVADETQKIVMANPAAATIFRCPLERLVGAPLEHFIPERFREKHRRDVNAFGAEEAGARRMGARPEVRGLRADGEEFPVDASISDLKIDNRHHYMVILRDVTELRHAQDELARSHDELRRLVAAQEDVRENERKRIAREIHDELQQTLAAIKIDLGAIAGRVRSDPDAALAMLTEADRLAAEAVGSTRRIVNDLRPRLLDDFGLVPALEVLLQQFAQRHHVKCRLDARDSEGSELQAPAAAATCLYRITQEALQNVAKHAGASRVDVQLLEPRPGWLRLRIADDGSGLAEDDLRKPQSYGLIGMRERVRALGGRLAVASPPDGGTVIELELPTSANPAAD